MEIYYKNLKTHVEQRKNNSGRTKLQNKTELKVITIFGTSGKKRVKKTPS